MAGWIDVEKPINFTSDHGNGLLTGLGPSGLLLSWLKDPPLDGSAVCVEVLGYAYKGSYTQGTLELTLPPEGLMGALRKSQHLQICEQKDVESSDRYTGFEDYDLMPYALSEINQDQLDTRTDFLGQNFKLPFLITGMTGGVQQGLEINERLASAAAAFGIPMGVGSQRIALEDPALASVFQVKHKQPGVFLIGNVGLAQILTKKSVELCKRAVDMIQADALAIHLNVIQELVQVEGDSTFHGVLEAIALLCSQIEVPIVVKEVGCGIDPRSAQELMKAGVAALDVGGRGGTSWGHIEGLRAKSERVKRLGLTFRDWGIPTAHSVSQLSPNATCPLVATGGMRNGLMVAKAVGLGATMAGIGLPLMKAAMKSEEAVHEELEFFQSSLQIAMMASGCQNIPALKHAVVPSFTRRYQS